MSKDTEQDLKPFTERYPSLVKGKLPYKDLYAVSNKRIEQGTGTEPTRYIKDIYNVNSDDLLDGNFFVHVNAVEKHLLDKQTIMDAIVDVFEQRFTEVKYMPPEAKKLIEKLDLSDYERNQEVTLADIREAINLGKEQGRETRTDYDWGFVEFEYGGFPLRIGFNDKVADALKKAIVPYDMESLPRAVPTHIFGIEVYATPALHMEMSKE